MADVYFKITTMPDLPSASANLAAATIQSIDWAGITTEEKVVAGAGTNTSEEQLRARRFNNELEDDAYNSAVVAYSEDDEQTVRESLPELSDSRQFPVMAQLLNTIQIVGGEDEKGYSSVAECYTSEKKHIVLPRLAIARSDFAAASSKEDALYAGGAVADGVTDTIEQYIINMTRRDLNRKLPVAVRGLFGIYFAGRYVFGGGRDKNGMPVDNVISFDKDFNTTELEPLSVPRYNLGAVIVYNPDDTTEKYLLVLGGKGSHNGFSKVVDVYDQSLKKVTQHDLELDIGRSRFSPFTLNGYGIIPGGIVGTEPQDEPTDNIEIINWKLKKIQTTIKLPEPKNSFATAVLGGNKGMIFGGYTSSGSSKSVACIEMTDTPAPKQAKVIYHWEPTTAKYNWVD